MKIVNGYTWLYKKAMFAFFYILIFQSCGFDQEHQISQEYIVTSDIDNYWNAYDKVVSTTDTILQLQYINEYFIDKASPGQKTMFEVRNYSPEEYVNNINQYPKFWKSIRNQTLKAKALGGQIEQAVARFKTLYPEMKRAKVYFTIGAFRSPGTTLDSLVLIGSEMALADSTTDTSEFPEQLQYVKNYFKTNPVDNVEFLNIHEFVHTQQQDARGASLLVQCLREGIAEFVAVKASGDASPFECIAYGKQNEEQVKTQLKKELFNRQYSYWLWSQLDNQFNQRDLGYFVGYEMAELYFNKQEDKRKAIKELIELDLNNEKAVEKFVDQTSFFAHPLATLLESYKQQQPTVIGMKPFADGSAAVAAGTYNIEIEFSEPMDKRFRGFEYGPLGEQHVLRIQKYIGFSENGKSVSFEVEVMPNKHYQLMLSSRFTNLKGTGLLPYTIEIKSK